MITGSYGERRGCGTDSTKSPSPSPPVTLTTPSGGTIVFISTDAHSTLNIDKLSPQLTRTCVSTCITATNSMSSKFVAYNKKEDIK